MIEVRQDFGSTVSNGNTRPEEPPETAPGGGTRAGSTPAPHNIPVRAEAKLSEQEQELGQPWAS